MPKSKFPRTTETANLPAFVNWLWSDIKGSLLHSNVFEEIILPLWSSKNNQQEGVKRRKGETSRKRSLRTIDWLFPRMSEEYGIRFILTDKNEILPVTAETMSKGKFVDLCEFYKRKLSLWTKLYWDEFRRHTRIDLEFQFTGQVEPQREKTTLAQLHFFSEFVQSGGLAFADQFKKQIDQNYVATRKIRKTIKALKSVLEDHGLTHSVLVPVKPKYSRWLFVVPSNEKPDWETNPCFVSATSTTTLILVSH